MNYIDIKDLSNCKLRLILRANKRLMGKPAESVCIFCREEQRRELLDGQKNDSKTEQDPEVEFPEEFQ